jgi:hypothetical protein
MRFGAPEVMHVKVAGVTLFAVVCSSWVFMNQATSGRDAFTPLGNVRHLYVRDANVMVARASLLIRLCVARRVEWVLENPLSSMIHFHSRIQQLVRERFRMFRISLRLGDFGAPTAKPIILYCSSAWPSKLQLVDKIECVDRGYSSSDVVSYTVDTQGLHI